MRLHSVLLPLCLAAQIGSANAAVVLDQFHNPPIYSVVQARSLDYQGQTFTIGVDGTLDSLRLAIGNYNVPPVDVDFHLAHIESNVIRFSQSIDLVIQSSAISPNGAGQGPTFADWLTLDFSPFNIQVAQGDQFALVFHSPITFEETGWPDAHQINWFAGNPGTYSFGTPIQTWTLTDTPLNVRTDFDHAFAVYVSTVPEPSTWALLIMGFGAVGVSLRGRRGASSASPRLG